MMLEKLIGLFQSKKFTTSELSDAIRRNVFAGSESESKSSDHFQLIQAAYPDGRLPEIILDGMLSEITKLGAMASREEQARYLLLLVLQDIEETRLWQCLASNCDDHFVPLVLAHLCDLDARYCESLRYIVEDDWDDPNAIEAIKERRAVFWRDLILVIVRRAALEGVYEELFRRPIDNEIIRRYELIVGDHFKKLQFDLMMLHTEQGRSSMTDQVLSLYGQNGQRWLTLRIEAKKKYRDSVLSGNTKSMEDAISEYLVVMEEMHDLLGEVVSPSEADNG